MCNWSVCFMQNCTASNSVKFKLSESSLPFWSRRDKVNSVKEAGAKCFAVHTLKFEILHTTWKNKAKQHENDEKLKSKGLMYFVSFFFMWFGRYQILTHEPQSIWRKLLPLSWLYYFARLTFCYYIYVLAQWKIYYYSIEIKYFLGDFWHKYMISLFSIYLVGE